MMIAVAVALVLSACGKKEDEAGEKSTTTAKEADPTTTAPDVEAAIAAFCSSGNDYVDALDQYTGLFSGTTPDVTVGQVQDGVSQLAEQREKIEQAASDLEAAVKAFDAQEAEEAGTTTTVEGVTTTTTVVTEQTAAELVAQINKAEDDFDAAVSGIDANTPVSKAEDQFTSAAYAVQVAWSMLLTEAGCVEDEGAVEQVRKFVASLQTDLQTLGFYEGTIDGIFGPETTAALKSFQESVGITQSGLPDPATQRALSEKLAAKAAVSTSALQGLLAGLGLYTGPIDGQWSPELEAAVKALQAALDVPQTGVMDRATLQAYANRKAGLQELVAYEQRMATSTTTAAPTTTSAPTTTAAPPTTAAPTTTAAPSTTTSSTTTTSEP
jgi:peptidoglycan hydrolase-like protein with peptidoglycan-binding domain